MGKDAASKEVVTYGAAKATVWQRGDGRWAVSWSVGGRDSSTTRGTKEEALKAARAKVREIVGGLGTRAMSVADAGLLEELQRVCGGRDPRAVLAELEAARRELRGVPLLRAVAHWSASGMGAVEEVTVKRARDEFLDSKEKRSVFTKAGLRKELSRR